MLVPSWLVVASTERLAALRPTLLTAITLSSYSLKASSPLTSYSVSVTSRISWNPSWCNCWLVGGWTVRVFGRYWTMYDITGSVRSVCAAFQLREMLLAVTAFTSKLVGAFGNARHRRTNTKQALTLSFPFNPFILKLVGALGNARHRITTTQ